MIKHRKIVWIYLFDLFDFFFLSNYRFLLSNATVVKEKMEFVKESCALGDHWLTNKWSIERLTSCCILFLHDNYTLSKSFVRNFIKFFIKLFLIGLWIVILIVNCFSNHFWFVGPNEFCQRTTWWQKYKWVISITRVFEKIDLQLLGIERSFWIRWKWKKND